MGRPKQVADADIARIAREVILRRGAGVSAVDIAREIGVSHTTLFNRFGSKEGLLIAALGVPAETEWIAALERGPDDRSITEQLVEHGKVMAAYFQRLHDGLAVLQAAGIGSDRIFADRSAASTPVRGYQAMVDWLKRAQHSGRLAVGDVDALATTIMGSLYNWAFTADICGHSTSPKDANLYVEQFVTLLWAGIAPDAELR
jgi:AcrR family transcriptional regulator